MATQVASNRLMNNLLRIRKFFGKTMIKISLVEISTPPKSTFLGGVVELFLGHTIKALKPSEKGSEVTQYILGLRTPTRVKNS